VIEQISSACQVPQQAAFPCVVEGGEQEDGKACDGVHPRLAAYCS